MGSPGIELTPPAVGACSLNRRTAREVPVICSLTVQKVFPNPEVITYLFHLQDFYCVIFFPHFTLVHLEFIFIYHARWGSKLIFSPKWLRHKPNWCDIMLLFNNSLAFFTVFSQSFWCITQDDCSLRWHHSSYYMSSTILSTLSPVYPQHLGIWQDLHKYLVKE